MNKKRWLTVGMVTAVFAAILLIGSSLNRTNTESAVAQDGETAVAFIGNLAATASAGGDFVATASYIVRPRGPLSWLDPDAFGTLGAGGGFALAAKLCRPEARETVGGERPSCTDQRNDW